VGFDFRTGTHAYAPAQPVSLHAPLAYQMVGLVYRYGYLPAVRRVGPIPGPAWDGFYLLANDISTVYDGLERWTLDERGLTYFEPREIRKVAGFPQYSPGVVVLKRNPRPIWVPVSREWALQRQLAQRRKNLDSIAESAKAAGAYNPTAILEKWLGERPERQREMEKSYAEMKQSNPEYAEKIRANFFETEKRVEKTMRETAERQKAAPPRYDARFAAERSREEKCIRDIKAELARLSPAELAAPAYVRTRTFDSKRSSPEPSCSCIVDPDYPEAIRLVTENPDYYDKDLPPSAIQLILVDFRLFEGHDKSARHRPLYYERIRDGLDYSALAAMLQE